MSYRVQVGCWDQDGRPCHLEPKDVLAASYKEAAENLCGKGLFEGDNSGHYAAVVWGRGETKPEFRFFYRG